MYKPEELALLRSQILDKCWQGKSLIKTLKEIEEAHHKDKTKPKVSRATVYEWLNPNSIYYEKQFSDDYARTREIQGDWNAEKVDDLAAMVESKELAPDVARVAMDAHKWSAGVKKPKKYGNKQYIEQKSAVTVQRAFYDMSCLSDKELETYDKLTRKIMVANGEDPDEDPTTK